MRDVLLVPGIGGHPRFHQPLIDSLSERHRVHTSPHGDFFSEPYVGLAPHSDYWCEFASKIASDSLVVIAISFGAHIVPRLIEDSSLSISHIILISPWVPSAAGRIILTLASMLPQRLVSQLFCRKLMIWSERTGSLDDIQKLRAELYDDRTRVAARWRRRLLAIPEGLRWETLSQLAESRAITLIFGENEWLNRAQRRKMDDLVTRRVRLTVRRLPGGHEISAISSPCLSELIKAELC